MFLPNDIEYNYAKLIIELYRTKGPMDKDVTERLEDANKDRSSYEVSDDTVRIRCWLIKDAIKEIKYLRERILDLEADHV